MSATQERTPLVRLAGSSFHETRCTVERYLTTDGMTVISGAVRITSVSLGTAFGGVFCPMTLLPLPSYIRVLNLELNGLLYLISLS